MKTIHVWIVEDDAVYRRTLKRMLEGDKRIVCSRVFPSCVELFEVIETGEHPDLVLMDLGLPDMGGIEGIRKLASLAPDVTVLVLTVFREKQKVVQALDAGAAGYLLKTDTARAIIEGVHQVVLGGSPLSPAVARVVLEELRKPAPKADFHLTARELEVVEKLAEGLPIKQIADTLGISRRTAAFHLEKIYEKLKVQSQSGAVAKALRSGII